MNIASRSCCLLLAISLALPVVMPTTARAADDDPTNDIVAFGLLGLVVGILVYVGWKMDKQDKEPLSKLDSNQVLAATDDSRSRLLFITAPTREDEQVAAVGYGLSF